ncbi:MAG: type 11 methyltransferase [Ignavibacteria bacterium]|nr:MAG: type 11 methyltransferase [Ignavibacteria bacterium]KAF0161027.1 MAG: type 11 methyltransferase [Ignavibacteria bacterium]
MKSVKEYYDKTGWTKQKGGYVDALSFTTTKGNDYKNNCNERLRKLIGEPELLLDVACGASPLNSKAKKQLCIDFSITAVTEAKKNKPDGFFVLGDITALPLKDNSVTDTVSMHTIYHVHKDKQEEAIKEITRVTKNKCYIVYNAGKHARLVNILSLPLQLWNWSEKRINPNSKRKIYFYAHSYKWLEKFGEVKTYRLLNENCIKLYSRLLWLASKFEMRFSKHSYHPLLVIDKNNDKRI